MHLFLCGKEDVTGGKGSLERLMQDGQGGRWSLHQDIRKMFGRFSASTHERLKKVGG